ncbi:MAG: DNA mismatch repair protein MutS [Pseudomonadota bacterium]
MMAQYIEIKAANPNSLLFYRMGDFYELFFHDAEVAARALGITLTKRGKHMGADIPMCGVPVHAANDYLQKLIALGHRVAVCEQVEDPAEAKQRGSKAVVQRDVVRLVTPGTITEEALLEPGEANSLAVIARAKADGDALALASIDISTGQFTVHSTSIDTLSADLARLAPRELVLSERLEDDDRIKMMLSAVECVVQRQSAALFDSTKAAQALAQFYGVQTLDGFGQFSRSELSALHGAISYLKKTQFAERPALSRPHRESAGAFMFIDAATRANLELTQTLAGEKKGSLLRAIDRTVSGGGARLLAAHLSAPLTDVAAIENRLDAVSWSLDQEALRTTLRRALASLPDMPRTLSRLSLNRGGPRDLAGVASGLTVAQTIAGHLLPMQDDAVSPFGFPKTLRALSAVLQAIPANLHRWLTEALADDVPILARDGGFIRAGRDAELDSLRRLAKESRQIIAELQATYAHDTGVKSLKIKHNNVLGFFIEVTALNADALLADKERFIHRQTLASAMRFTTTELADLESRIANAGGKALEIELAHFERLRKAVVDAADTVRAIANALAQLDVTQALATLAEEQGYARPKITDGLDFAIVAGRHPVVEQSLRAAAANPFVPNGCDLSGVETGHLWLLTGPNMGGKSTFLRQNALIAIMAQMGSFVPAGSATLGVVDRLFSRVGAADDLARGRSTFMVEMVETAAILNQAGPRSFVILDEIGRGTATFDGLSIAWAAIEHLHEKNGCRTLFATHYHELTALSQKLDRLKNVTLKVREWEGDVVFLHEITPGTADRSYGIQVAKLAGLPNAVVDRARDVLHQLEDQRQDNALDKMIDELPLFSATPQKGLAPTGKSAIQSPALTALADINPDDLSPREALDALYRIKSLTGGEQT